MFIPSFVIPDEAVAPIGYKLTNSLRFNGTNSRIATATMTASNNPKKWTWNGWVKRGKLSVAENLFGNGLTSSGSQALVRLMFLTDDVIQFYMRNSSGVSQAEYRTVGKFRDTSAFYNIGIAYDSAQANADDRFKMYINGVELVKGTQLTVANPVDLDATPPAPFDTLRMLGAQNTGAAYSAYLDGVISGACFVDGQALVPDGNFGEFDTNGRFVPIDPTGVITDFGKNGSRLLFNNGTSLATLGYDSAPINGAHASLNNWTIVNLTAADAQLFSSPSTNFATGNPQAVAASGGVGVWSFGQLTLTLNSTTKWGSSNIALKDQPVYSEFTCQSGVGSTAATLVTIGVLEQVGNSWMVAAGYTSDGKKVVNDVSSAFAVAYATGDIIGVAVNPVTKKVTFYKKTGIAARVLVGEVDYSAVTITGPLFIGADSGTTAGARVLHANFGQLPPATAAPDGYGLLKPAGEVVIKSGSLTGNFNVNGPFIFMNGTPETFSVDTGSGLIPVPTTSYDKLANGVKIRVSTGPNVSGTHAWEATVLSPESKSAFINRNAQMN